MVDCEKCRKNADRLNVPEDYGDINPNQSTPDKIILVYNPEFKGYNIYVNKIAKKNGVGTAGWNAQLLKNRLTKVLNEFLNYHGWTMRTE